MVILGVVFVLRFLFEDMNLVLGKYVRVVLGRDYGVWVCILEDVIECFIVGCGEVFFMDLLVVLLGLCILDFEIVDCVDYYIVFGKVCVVVVVG